MLLCSCSFASARKPNVVIIYTDDQGFGDASCLNSDAKFQTPNLDRLAAEGIAFTNGHSSDSVCTPSRYGLLTGRYAWRTTLKRGVMGAEGKCLIADGQSTVASMLRDQGYRTVMVGKWHLGMDFPGTSYADRDWSQPVKDMPLDKGFDEFFGIPASLNYGVLAWFDGRFAKVPPTLFTAKKPNRRHMDYRIMPPYQKSPEETKEVVGKTGMEVAPDFVDNQCLTRFTDHAIDWIGTHCSSDRNEQPFFLYLPLTSPHYPVCPLPDFHGRGECGGYGEFVIETDYHVGRLMACLRKAGVDKDTLVIFTSDNGPESSWKKRVTDFGHQSNASFREGKRSVYEGGHRVPFFARWPNGIQQPGRTYDGLVGQIDVFSTLAEIVGSDLSVSDGVDSDGFAAVFASPAPDRRRLPLVNHGFKGRFSVTLGTWKLVMPFGQLERELYDLSADPGEKTNVIERHPDKAAELEKELTRIVSTGRTTEGSRMQNDTGYWKDLTWMTSEQYDAGGAK